MHNEINVLCSYRTNIRKLSRGIHPFCRSFFISFEKWNLKKKLQKYYLNNNIIPATELRIPVA